jgi:hypothetical protein
MTTEKRSKPLVAIVAGAVVGIMVIVGVFAAFALNVGAEECPPMTNNPEWSVARQWNEAALDAIRRDLPAPTVHARNLYHTSAAMWDAWAAYDSDALGVFVDDDADAADIDAARDRAISYAAYRVLESRYINSIGASETIPQLDQLMTDLCYPIDVTVTDGDTPAALGNRIARSILDAGTGDGSNEAEGYVSDSYVPVNDALTVDASGTVMIDPNRWQPLQIEEMISQNGIPVENGTQEFIGPFWGFVTGFALPESPSTGVPIDPGPPPYLGTETDQQFKDAAVEVIGYSSLLDPTDAAMIDISPTTIGANPLGTQDGTGYQVNPVTGQPYETVTANEGDFGRSIAEFWADGPDSETPPGHWNTLANEIGDSLGEDLMIAGMGEQVPRLEWDVKTYLALNGANHDAAIAAWGTKGYYDYVRPISMIRWMGGLGQSSDRDEDAYHVDGLPLEPGLVEVVSTDSTKPGERHAALVGHEGEIAVLSYAGNPADPETDIGGVDWILAVDWIPYQAPTFVTPAFAGYVSGHSAFSRASAEVLTAMTGSEFFPGGLGEWMIAPGALEFESGTDNGVRLQWATYRDAADQAGISRLYGGIHVPADDFAGRILGAEIGVAAWEKALEFFGAPSDEG